MNKAVTAIRRFNEERDWDQFHSPENLAKSIAIESGELLECFQWSDRFNQQDVYDELGDVGFYCVNLADKLGVDLETLILKKLDKTVKKYPVEKCKGKSTKYNKLK